MLSGEAKKQGGNERRKNKMKLNIEEYNINKFKEYCEVEKIDLDDEQDLENALNKFLENNLDLLF